VTDTYRHKSTGLEVQALQVDFETVDRIANWAQAQVVEEIDPISKTTQEGLNIKTPDGKKRASRGSYVVGVKGRFYVVGEEGFEEAYEPVQVRHQAASRAPEVYEMSPTDDPFEGMTRFNDGPRP
jgi:hypothetical protein